LEVFIDAKGIQLNGVPKYRDNWRCHKSFSSKKIRH